MAKRFTDTEIWSEDWFLEMPNEYKLFWFYMLANCDHAGLFKVNLRSFRGLLEVEVRSTKALEYFNNSKIRIREISDTLWFIEDFFVFQYGTNLNLNNKVHESIANLLTRQKIELTSIRGLIDLKERVKDKDKDKDKKGGVGENKNGKAVRIDVENKLAVFADGSTQPLGVDQLEMLSRNQLSPQSVVKNRIY